MKRTEDEIKDLLLDAIENRQIYTIRKLRKQLAEKKQQLNKESVNNAK